MRPSGVADSVPDFGPPYIKGFFVVLPDAIPVADRSSWTFITGEPEPELDGVGVRAFPNLPPFGVGKPGRNFVGIRFHQIRDDALSPLEADHRILNLAVDRIHRPGEAPEPGPAPIGLQRYRSVAELATFVADVADLVTTPAFAAAARLAGHIADRLHYRFRTFPATAWVFLGAPGFESRGGITTSAQKWLDSQAGEVKSHIKAYRDWRAEVNNAVQRRRIST
jgi:hypothetical protein